MNNAALFPTYNRAALTFERGHGSWLVDAGGTEYLDFAAGIAVNSLGHCHPHLVSALAAQAERLWHTSNLYHIAGQERLAERLVALSFADRAFFGNSGAEAVECAIKTARRAHSPSGRHEIVTFAGAFHGRTLATIAASGNEAHMRGFGPPLAGFVNVPPENMAALEAAIGPHTAGIMVEPVQGEGGIRPLEAGFLRALRAVCDDRDLCLIFDEVQCGIGRTGRLFAHEWTGIAPDIMAIAKGLGGGFPVGACLARERYAEAMEAGSHGSTFGGNPLAAAVANAVCDIVSEPGFLRAVEEKGRLLRHKLAQLVDAQPGIFAGLRGQGLMLGLRCHIPPGRVVDAARGEKLLLVGAGDNVVRILPPLTVSHEEIGEACARLGRAACHVSKTDERRPS